MRSREVNDVPEDALGLAQSITDLVRRDVAEAGTITA
jgi:hypothetical protein